MSFSTNDMLGSDFSATYTVNATTPEYPNPPFQLGQIAEASNGSEWVFVKAAAAITGAGYVCFIDPLFNATMLTTANALRGAPVGVANTAFNSGDYGWVQRKGPCVVRASASAAANVVVSTTATAGQGNTGLVITSVNMDGLFLTTANGGSAGNAPGVLNYPILGSTN